MTERSAAVVWAKALVAPAVASLVSTRIYESLAPQDTVGEYILLVQSSYTEFGTDITGNLGAGNMLLTVKAVTKGSGYDRAEAIYQPAHDAIQKQTGTAEGCDIMFCSREQMIAYLEMPAGTGVIYAHLGGVYRIFVKSSV